MEAKQIPCQTWRCSMLYSYERCQETQSPPVAAELNIKSLQKSKSSPGSPLLPLVSWGFALEARSMAFPTSQDQAGPWPSPYVKFWRTKGNFHSIHSEFWHQRALRKLNHSEEAKKSWWDLTADRPSSGEERSAAPAVTRTPSGTKQTLPSSYLIQHHMNYPNIHIYLKWGN